MYTIVTIPAIAAIVYTLIDIVKTACGGDEKFKRFIPLITVVLGAICGVIAFYFVPGVIETENVLVAIIIGANDVVNPAAIEDKSSPIYGMPIVNAFEAKTVFVLKRGKGTGFSGLENPLFTADNTVMIYGDAKDTVSRMVAEFDEK